MSNTFNFHAENQQNQVGDNNSQTMNIAGGGVELEAFLKALEATIKEVEPEQVEALPEDQQLQVPGLYSQAVHLLPELQSHDRGCPRRRNSLV